MTVDKSAVKKLVHLVANSAVALAIHLADLMVEYKVETKVLQMDEHSTDNSVSN
jgi:hypothetical protein